jgi:hypothetical protein
MPTALSLELSGLGGLNVESHSPLAIRSGVPLGDFVLPFTVGPVVADCLATGG